MILLNINMSLKLTPSLALVLIYDVLYGSDQMTVKGPLTRCILRHKNILKQAVLSVERNETELSYDHSRTIWTCT